MNIIIPPPLCPNITNTTEPKTPDPRDLTTPDSWISRDPSPLTRLTGRHPLNAEPFDVSELVKQGWITPVDWQYVRNHGTVPKVLENDLMDYKLLVEG
jgi:nitrate reductase (NAD(P)H)